MSGVYFIGKTPKPKNRHTSILEDNASHILNSSTESNTENDNDLERVLEGTLIYVDVRAENENRSKAISRELQRLGAQIADKIGPFTTHVVFKDGRKSTVSQLKKYPKIHVVSVLWVESCKSSKCKVVEELFTPSLQGSVDSPLPLARAKRVKSLQPKSFEEDINNSAKKEERRKKRLKRIEKSKEVFSGFPFTVEEKLLFSDDDESDSDIDDSKDCNAPCIEETPLKTGQKLVSISPEINKLSEELAFANVNDSINELHSSYIQSVLQESQSDPVFTDNILEFALEKKASIIRENSSKPNQKGDAILTTNSLQPNSTPASNVETKNECFEEIKSICPTEHAGKISLQSTRSSLETNHQSIRCQPSDEAIEFECEPVSSNKLEMDEISESRKCSDVSDIDISSLATCNTEKQNNCSDLNPDDIESVATKSKSKCKTSINKDETWKSVKLSDSSDMDVSNLLAVYTEKQNRRSSSHAKNIGNSTITLPKRKKKLFNASSTSKLGSPAMSDTNCKLQMGAPTIPLAGLHNETSLLDFSRNYTYLNTTMNQPIKNMNQSIKNMNQSIKNMNQSIKKMNVSKSITADKKQHNGKKYESILQDVCPPSFQEQCNERISHNNSVDKNVTSKSPTNCIIEDQSSETLSTSNNIANESKFKNSVSTDLLKDESNSLGFNKSKNVTQRKNIRRSSERVQKSKTKLHSPDSSLNNSNKDEVKDSKHFSTKTSKPLRRSCEKIKTKRKSITKSTDRRSLDDFKVIKKPKTKENISLSRKHSSIVNTPSTEAVHGASSTSQTNLHTLDIDSGISDSEEKIDGVDEETSEYSLHVSQSFAASICNANSSRLHNKSCNSLVMTSLHFGEQDFVKAAVKKLNVFYMRSKVLHDTTHVVAGCGKRTLNILYAIINGCWILNTKWVSDSYENGYWMEEREYEMCEEFPIAKQSRLHLEEKKTTMHAKLFAQAPIVYLSEVTKPPTDELTQLITACGGKVTSTLRKAGVIVGNISCRRKDLPNLSEKWILDSIMNCRMMPTNDYDMTSSAMQVI